MDTIEFEASRRRADALEPPAQLSPSLPAADLVSNLPMHLTAGATDHATRINSRVAVAALISKACCEDVKQEPDHVARLIRLRGRPVRGSD
jgi:hypothetical protein